VKLASLDEMSAQAHNLCDAPLACAWWTVKVSARWRWAYIEILFLLGMHSRVDERSGAVSGYGELERGMALVLKNERWIQGECSV
jgi:hypothetical protein